jgi:hypothetical protein
VVLGALSQIPFLSLESLQRPRAETPFSYAGSDIKATASVGVARLTPTCTAELLLSSAVAELYSAKHAVRNRVEYAASGAPRYMCRLWSVVARDAAMDIQSQSLRIDRTIRLRSRFQSKTENCRSSTTVTLDLELLQNPPMFSTAIKPARFALCLSASLLAAAPVFAGLGGDAASVRADAADLGGTAESADAADYIIAQISTDSGMQVREFSNRAGAGSQ